ncbi:alpha/beta hydrolase family protein, partial [Mucilaginibacter sp.]|uniref:alpha/beta hydrolase family protein n=1 Tax=Mucilaginibacter sp. TaxID=1882438 RepID=UPI002ED375F0
SAVFTGSKTGITYGATLTLPKVNKPCPAVVIVSGTGKQNRDGAMAGHKLFLTIANYLSNHGIAVLRVDDRGTGKTTGVYETATTADFADDALSAVDYLKTITGINPNKIGLLGHSEGGAAISIAAANSTDVKFLVSVAGLATNGLEAQILQNEALVNSAPIPDYDKKRFNQVDSLMFKTALQYADADDMEKHLMDTFEVWRKKDSVYFQTLHVQFDHFRFPIYSWSKTAAGPWYRYFIKYDAAKFLTRVKVPILALNGDKDLMVAYKQNLDNWKKYPEMGGNKDVTTVVMPGLNHLFLPCVKCNLQEYPEIKSDFSPDALKIISDWITKKFN